MRVLPRELATTYEILEELREGGMGAVYKARHRHLDEVCVIKVMHARLQRMEEARERFLGEAKKGKQLRHRHIAEVLNFFVSADGTAFLIMEYVDGVNLRELLLANGPLPPRLVVTLGTQALSALAALHEKNIVHRDISPENLMIARSANGEPLIKLIDLGIAKSLDETNLTRTGLFVGKVSYAAPEQFEHRCDARSDLYSLGVVLYELLTGTRPIGGTDAVAIFAAIQRSDPPRPFSETDPEGRVPSALRDVVLKALERNPDARFHSAAEFADALERSLAAEPTAAATTIPPTPERTEPMTSPPLIPTIRKWRQSRRQLTSVAAATVLVVSAAAVVQMFDQPPEQTAATVTAPTSDARPAQAAVAITAPPAIAPTDTAAAAGEMVRGKDLAARGRIEEAYAAFRRATASDPQNAFAWANLGGAAALLSRPEEARRSYERALSIDPDNWLAHYNLACQLTSSGEREEALRHVAASVAQLKQRASSRSELDAIVNSIREDEALGDLRNDPRFTALLQSD